MSRLALALLGIALDSADAAAGFTAEANNATVATTSGASTVVEEFSVNLRGSPLEMWWPEFQIKAKQGEGLFIRIQDTVADDVTIAMTAYIEEE